MPSEACWRLLHDFLPNALTSPAPEIEAVVLPVKRGHAKGQIRFMWFRRCSTEQCCHPGTDPCRTMSVPTQQDTPGSEDNARVPLPTRASVSCFVHAMAESTAFAAFGEHATLHVGGVFD